MKQSINKKYRCIPTLFLTFVFALCAVSANAQTTTFTYQGRFSDTTAQQPTNGTYTMTFRLFNAETGGTQIGTDITSMVSVVNNLFTAKLNFGAAAFATSGARYLEIQVGNTILAPRQEITSTPFSQRALTAANADSLGGVAANQFVQTNDSRLTDSRTPTAGSANYIQNGTTLQTLSNFNISGTGTADSFAVRGGGTGITLNNSFLRLKAANDNNHGILYNSSIDGMEFRANIGYRWVNGTGGATQRMALDSSGNLTVTGDITTNGTINGTLANNSVGSAQVTDGSLRLADTSVFGGTASFGPFTIPAHGCAGFNINLNSGTIAIGDILYFYPSNITPAGFYIQPTITTSLTTNAFYICNTLNTSNTFPAQTIRYNFVRP